MFNSIYRSAAIFFLLLPIFSCSTVLDPNKEFNEKYQNQVRSIVNSIPSKQNSEVDMYNKASFGSITPEDIVNESLRGNQQYYPYFDIRKFGQSKPKVHFPNMEIYDQSHFQDHSNQIPPDIFEVSYVNRIYPPFKYQGARFDSISVPSHGAYGVETAMTNKDYLLAGNNSIQNSVENIKNNKNTYDDQNSKDLIVQRKRLRHERKIEKIFGVSAANEAEIVVEKLDEQKSDIDELAKDGKDISRVVEKEDNNG